MTRDGQQGPSQKILRPTECPRCQGDGVRIYGGNQEFPLWTGRTRCDGVGQVLTGATP